MASYSIQEFVGNGVLKVLLPKLLNEGWDDVPTLKIMSPEDMDAINMTPNQKEALKIRKYLHDHALLQYGDRLEASEKPLSELLNLTMADLASQFGMKRGHVARFIGTTRSSSSRNLHKRQDFITGTPSLNKFSSRNFSRNDSRSDETELRIKDGYVFKGIVAAAGPTGSRLACSCVKPAATVEEMPAPYTAIENITVEKLTPEYKIGIVDGLEKTKINQIRASELWREKPAILLCIRRPGCIMCRAEAHQLYAKKPIFDTLGVQLFAVLHEQIESEVRDFWPRYWGGAIISDKGLGFFKALGGGKVLKEKFLTGFVFNPKAISNYKRAKAMGLNQNFKGEGEIKGGLFIIGSGKSGIAYQFIEKNFGDWAPLHEVIDICKLLNEEPKESRQSLRMTRRASADI